MDHVQNAENTIHNTEYSGKNSEWNCTKPQATIKQSLYPRFSVKCYEGPTVI
jgi:hypothetical protein